MIHFLLASLLLPSLAGASSFVIRSGNAFALDGNPFVAVGPNAFWLGLMQDPSIAYPTHALIEEAFIVAGYMNSTAIRSHTLGISSGDPLSLRPAGLNPHQANQSVVGSNVFNNAAWETIDYAFTMADKYNIKLIVPLTDAYYYFNGNYGDYCITRGVNKSVFFTDQGVRADFKDAISQYLNHVNQYSGIAIKNSPALFLIELGNELGNIRPDATSTVIPTQEWLADIAAYIKAIDMNHLIYGPTDEALGSATSQDFSVTQLDVFSSHFYYNDQNRMTTGVNAASAVGKPYVIGEFGSGIGADYYTLVESLKGIKGSLFWSLHPHANGIAGGPMIAHNDGYAWWIYSVYYPENAAQLLIIANHFQRMRGIPVTNSIGPSNSKVSSTTSVTSSTSARSTSSSGSSSKLTSTQTTPQLSPSTKSVSISSSSSKASSVTPPFNSTSKSATLASSSIRSSSSSTIPSTTTSKFSAISATFSPTMMRSATASSSIRLMSISVKSSSTTSKTSTTAHLIPSQAAATNKRRKRY